MKGGETAQVDWQPRPVERINDVKIALGHMNKEQLLQLEEYCNERIDLAYRDLAVVQEYRMHMYPSEASS